MEFPKSFIEYTRHLLGADLYSRLNDALSSEAPASIRLNPFKYRERIGSNHTDWEPVPWCDEGRYLKKRFTFTFDPLFHAGCYYVQEASSMFVEQAVKQTVSGPVVALDLCAAPGGKSTHLCSLLPEGSLLVSNEVMRNRVQVLAENLTKWGHSEVLVTNNDPSDFSGLDACFDLILTDVPCSGEGMFRKDSDAIGEWSEANVEKCRQRQRRIVKDIWPCLKPGGILIYSTCTYNTKENEENIVWLTKEFGAQPITLDVSDEWQVMGNLLQGSTFPVYRFLPCLTKGEGFFLAVLRKPELESDTSLERSSLLFKQKKNRKQSSGLLSTVNPLMVKAKDWILAPDSYDFSIKENKITAFSKKYAGILKTLANRLRIVQAGVEIGEVKGKDLIPSHQLSISHALNKNAFPTESLEYDAALNFLRKESVILSPSVQRGYVLLMYQGIPLGFVKNIGNRTNNLYPQSYRIRSTYTPDNILKL